MEFLGWEAAIAAGATLSDMLRWERREFSREFMARVVAWYQYHRLVSIHTEDAARPKRGSK